MNRRTLLAAAGTGTAALAGCFDSEEQSATNGSETPVAKQNSDSSATDGGDGRSESEREYEWYHDVGGRVDTVANGTVFGTENSLLEESDRLGGGIFALDRETGDHLWTHGSSGMHSTYTEPTVADAVYAGYGDDVIGNGAGKTIAVGHDGELRWSRETGSVYSRPRVADDTVYVGGDDGVVHAFATDDGTTRWSERVSEPATASRKITVAAVTDSVYVTTGRLLSLDPDDGNVRWTYGDGDDRIRDATIDDGTAYVSTRDGIAAIADGAERWHADSESSWSIRAVDTERVVVDAGNELVGLDVETGDRQWTIEGVDRATVSVPHERIYVAGDRVRAYGIADGDELWRESITDSASVESLQIAGDGDTDAHSVIARIGDTRFSRLDPTGDVTGTASVDAQIKHFAVDDAVIAGTRDGIYSLALE
ncbi:PQQ-like beta-propeller repeat protein [Natrinema versiforme]|uniref:Pyrrolo-quinoline quinone repeat domain-containing protein n=1 Tax=Natrinema versiforme TaxID=88724 RepID=A0A4P8WGQ7_9EURY|nr:PQQ-like beta-propeller repeat protein [Natrinema versiforme]QCS42304.1 hypothetical protein FEJ81_08005 [Natrinema versiforme]